MTVREYRIKHNLSQVDMAERLGISQGTLSDIERDRRPISKGMALKLVALDPEEFDLAELLTPQASVAA